MGRFAGADEDYMKALHDAMQDAFNNNDNGINLSPVLRLQPISEAQLGRPNQLIVGEMWSSYVLDRPKIDVMILYFDPKCPHCEKMRPILDQLALEASNKKSLYPNGNLAVLELDVTNNDPLNDLSWTTPNAVPAIHLYPALSQSADSSKQHRIASDFIAYQGKPDLTDLKTFLLEHAVYQGKPSHDDKSEL